MTDNLFDGIDEYDGPRPKNAAAEARATERVSAEIVRGVLESLRHAPGFSRNIAHWHEQPARPPRYAEWPAGLDPRIVRVLTERGIPRPYTHQADAIRIAGIERKSVCVVTPTASGKTLCYNVPVIDAILKNPKSRALYLFPTKALSHDQYREVYDVAQGVGEGIKIYTFDGDTPQAARATLRNAGQIVVTNPDMLHTGILPHHSKWMKLFENLTYVVIDEVHQYRGVFGSHVANVIRRLTRICEFYRSRPTFICCSATIANPRELAESLLEQPVELVDRNGAPAGKKTFIFYNPPIVNAELGIRRSVKTEARRLAARFLSRDIQTLIFARSRLLVEVIATYLRRTMVKLHRSPDAIAGYRSGYLPSERRAIEQGIKSGRLLGIVSTNALELGIDIGSLDVAILAGWPGSVASAWQQGGRAGRKAGDSAVILIADSSALDQFLMSHPEYFFGAPAEQGIVNPDNLSILVSHLKCACFELPFENSESFGRTRVHEVLERLEEGQVLRHSGDRWYFASDAYPAEEVSLRAGVEENFVVLDTSRENKLVAEVDFDSAPFLIHPDAIYIHQGRQYVVDRLDWDGRAAYVRPCVVDYYTDPQASTNIQILAQDQQIALGIGAGPRALAQAPAETKNFGDVSVATVIAKFKKVKFETHESVGYGVIDVPQQEIQTEAYWLTFRDGLKEEFEAQGLDLAAGLRGLSNLLRNTIPIYVLCDPRDFSTIPMLRAPHDLRATLYVYDRYPGGIGIARRLFAIDRQVLDAAAEIVRRCKCRSGCPSCVGPRLEAGETAREAVLKLLAGLSASLE